MNKRRRAISITAVLGLVMFLIGSTLSERAEVFVIPQDRPADDIAFEATQTAKLLGV